MKLFKHNNTNLKKNAQRSMGFLDKQDRGFFAGRFSYRHRLVPILYQPPYSQV